MTMPWTWLKERFDTLLDRMRRPDGRAGRSSEESDADATSPMGGFTLRFLVAYLLVLFLAGGWVAWTVWAARPSIAAGESWSMDASSAPPAGSPVIKRIQPATVVFENGIAPLRLFGEGFDAQSKVLLNGDPARTVRFISPKELIADVPASGFAGSRSLLVTVKQGGNTSNTAELPVEADFNIEVQWVPPWHGAVRITAESRLLLLVVLLGLIGGILSAFNSLSAYRGNEKLYKSWALHYFVAPVLGAGMALLLYLVLRAGLLAGSDVRLDASSTPWGVVALSALAGLFYDKTFQKLYETFTNFLATKQDARTGKLTDPAPATASSGAIAIKTTKLKGGEKDMPYSAHLEASGGEQPYSWTVTPALPTGLSLDPLTGEISGTPRAKYALTKHEFTVSDMKRATAKVTLELGVRE